jgi:hypothetical protein
MIGLVTTAPGNVLARRSFFNLHNKKTKMKQIGIPSDARANIMEYGSVHIPGGRPYMRVSLRMNQASVTDSLADVLFSTLQKYKSKYNSKGQ